MVDLLKNWVTCHTVRKSSHQLFKQRLVNADRSFRRWDFRSFPDKTKIRKIPNTDHASTHFDFKTRSEFPNTVLSRILGHTNIPQSTCHGFRKSTNANGNPKLVGGYFIFFFQMFALHIACSLCLSDAHFLSKFQVRKEKNDNGILRQLPQKKENV